MGGCGSERIRADNSLMVVAHVIIFPEHSFLSMRDGNSSVGMGLAPIPTEERCILFCPGRVLLMPIRQLEPDVAAKIAAGEVVERPASVVKELIENSIDAGSTQIRVDLAHGGLQLIRVTDNGCGIAADELPLALARHATSKVARIDDLEHIRSLGFRGEALASIAAVAEVVLLSHQRGASQGAQISSVNGQVSEVGAAACPEGTIVTVRNL